jgi:FkbM family methyltransferase
MNKLSPCTKNIIFITGAPASGVSLLHDCLSQFGIPSPEDFSKASWFTCSDINNLFFQELGQDSISSEELPKSSFSSLAAHKAKEKIRELLSSLASDLPAWSMADPLFCHTFPLWRGVLEEAGADIRLIHIVRHPFETAKSISAAFDRDSAWGGRIWLTWNRWAVLHCRSYPHIIVTFDQLLADPVSTLTRIGCALRLTYPFSTPEAFHALLNHVQPGRRHHHAGTASDRELALFQPHIQAYNLFRACTASFSSPSGVLPDDSHALDHAVTCGPEDPSRRMPKPLEQELLQLLEKHVSLDEDAFSAGGNKTALTKSALARTHTSGKSIPDLATLFLPDQSGKGHPNRYALQETDWQKCHVRVYRTEHLKHAPIRFQPLNRPGVVRIASIRLLNLAADKPWWEAAGPRDFEAVNALDMAIRLPDEHHLLLVLTGDDAQIAWHCGLDFIDCPTAVEIVFRVEQDIDVAAVDVKELAGVLKGLLRQGRFVDALYLFDRCSGMNFAAAGDPELLTWLIRLLDESNRLFEAATCYGQAMSAKLPVGLFPIDIGRKLEQQGAWEVAETFYDQAVQFYRKRSDIRGARVRVLRKLGRFHEAEQFADQGLKQLSESTDLRIELGGQHLEENDRPAALALFQDAQARGFDFPLWVNRAISALTREMLDVYGIRLCVPAPIVSPAVLLPMIKGGYERSEMMFITTVIKPGDRVLELGGGIGFLACYLQSNIPNVRIRTVEANSDLIPLMEKNLRLNACRAEVIQGLAATQDGEATFNVAENFWSSSVMDIPSHYTTQKVRAIDTNRLIRDFKPNKMIIDIEGGEVDLVPGLHLSNIEALIIEVHQRYTGMNGVSKVFKAFLDKGFMVDLECSRGHVFTFVKI